MKVLIVDDVALAREAISRRLEAFPDITIIGEADNSRDALVLIDHLRPDTVFLDIEMPGGSGLDLARHLSRYTNLNLIFITAFPNYAHQAFRVDAVDYLLKPIEDEPFIEMMRKLEKRGIPRLEFESPESSSGYLTRLAVKDGNTTHMVPVEHIESIVSAGDYLCIRVLEKDEARVLVKRGTLKNIQALLDPNLFQRCHRSHLVNLQRVAQFVRNPDKLVCRTGEEHPISRRYLTKVSAHFTE